MRSAPSVGGYSELIPIPIFISYINMGIGIRASATSSVIALPKKNLLQSWFLNQN